MSAVVLALRANVTHLAVKFLRRGLGVQSDETDWFLAHMGHPWLVVDVGEAFARLHLKFFVLYARYCLEKGALAVGTGWKVWRQLGVELFEHVWLGWWRNILLHWLLSLVPDAQPIVQIFPALLTRHDVALVCGIHLRFGRSLCGVSRLNLGGGL